MIEIINEIVSSKMAYLVGAYYCVPITIAVIVLFFVKSSRDERGRAIIGKASIISTISFIVLINIFAKLSQYITINFLSTAICIQWIYNIILTIQVVAILIYKKIE